MNEWMERQMAFNVINGVGDVVGKLFQGKKK